MSDGEFDEYCDTSNLQPQPGIDDLSEYEKLRLKNIAERKAKFKEWKIKDRVLDLSKNNKKALYIFFIGLFFILIPFFF